jgi:hypothetical protein
MKTVPVAKDNRYIVSVDGDIYRKSTMRQLKPEVCANGYLMVRFGRDGGKQAVHRTVLESFVGICPDGMQACHNNGDRSDNRLSNLRWDTPKNNQADRKKHRTYLVGENHPKAKLSDEQVLYIRSVYKPKSKEFGAKALGKIFGVHPVTIEKIARYEQRIIGVK